MRIRIGRHRPARSSSSASAGLLVCLVPLIATMATAADHHLDAAVKSVNDFTLDFYLATVDANGPGKNVLVSPLSAALATAMVHAGAKGVTAGEIETVLHLPKDKTTLEKGFKSLHEALANTPNVTLDVANRIYVEKSSRLKANYKQTVKEVHNSEIQEADFIGDANGERAKINSWVSKKTHDKINNLLPEGVLDSLTRLVLVNAVYFYGKWKEQFDKQQTHDEDFYISKTKTVKVPMMHLTKNLKFAEIPELDAKAVELSYTNENVVLQIILPNAKDGLEALHEKLRKKTFDLSQISFYRTKVTLSLPKFKIEETINLKDIYQKMGITTMFGPQAEFTEMLEDGSDLYVSAAMQKTFIDVNEEGTEAAAATGFTLVALSAHFPDRIQVLKADHPFLVRLASRAGSSKLNLFSGHVADPRAAK